jgi:type IV pilus assembly protein PilY1
MKPLSSFRVAGIAAAVAAVMHASPVAASQTDIAAAPLGTAPTVTVLPNLMFILDDSGSMAREFMPDEVDDSTSCKSCSTSTCNVANRSCQPGYPPYYSAQFNTIYYNPQFTYKPGVSATGTSLGNVNPNNAINDPYSGSASSKDAVTKWTEVVWCNKSSPTTGELGDPNVCKKNGKNTPNPFVYKALSSGTDFTGGLPTTSFRFPFNVDSNPFYYEITPREHCTDETLVNCVLATTPSATNPAPAPLRWCQSTSTSLGAGDVNAVSGNTAGAPRCQAKAASTHRFPRLGNITRTDIVSTTPTYGNRPNRTDCAARPNCTYNEEIQNFANWYSYYRSRMLLMKTSAGLVFSTLDDRYRVGFITINASDSTRYLKIDKFTPTHKTDWFTKFYAMTPSGSTPLRQALSRVGRHYAGQTGGMNSFMPDEPMQYSCQQNFALLTTDGYWNSSRGKQIDGLTDIGNQDNVDGGFSTRAAGAFDGVTKAVQDADAGSTGSSNTLADVAMYYYKTDLRTSGTVAKDNVPTSTKDTAAHQHMVTFTLGMGLDGLMTYRPDYETATSGDFFKIKSASTGCAFSPSTTCDWPLARGDDPRALDDLWHAAVNGRGTYFSAKDPNAVQGAITSTLSSIQVTTGAAASSATSTPNITPTDNFIYSSTYRTLLWDGEVVAEKIDVTSGAIIPGIVWSARTLLNTPPKVDAAADQRQIWTFDLTSPTLVKELLYSGLTAQEAAFFDNKCGPAVPAPPPGTTIWPQCASLSAGDLAIANDGNNLVNWLRGQSQHEGIYRKREFVLGDTVNAKPAFVGKPTLQYGDAVTPDYASFKAGPAGSRQSVLYIASNEGMLHAFNADTGDELWAYVPRIVMPDLFRLAATNYDINHRYYVDGSPSPMDVFIGGQWKTIIVGGLNSGGRGYYALDVTDPLNPKGLWEVCSDATLCDVFDTDIGLTYGQAVITKRPTDGTWVVIVTSGYNNVSPGDGNGYLYVLDAETGKILSKTGTEIGGVPVGNVTTPSGFAKIAGFATNFAINNTTSIIYGGDLLGHVWRYDMTVDPPKVVRIGQTLDGSSPPLPQSITTRPEITRFSAGFNVLYVGTGRLLGSTDLQDPMTLVPPEPFAYQQSVYAFKDTGGDLGNLRDPGAKLVQQTLSVIDSSNRTISNNAVDWSTNNGWYVDFNPSNESPGERINIDMQLVRGVLLVATNEPNSDPCSSGGDSFFYQFDYQSGSYVASAPGSVVGTRSGSALMAGFVVYRLPSGQLKYTGIDVSGKKQTGGVNPGSGGAVGKRVSWRELVL